MESRALYRSFLRLAARWPEEPARSSRSLKEAILFRTRAQFRQNSTADASQVNGLLLHGRLELQSLNDMFSNAHRQEFQPEVKELSESEQKWLETVEYQLSTDTQKMQKKRGFISRLRDKFRKSS